MDFGDRFVVVFAAIVLSISLMTKSTYLADG
jgi:hypothetical protein